GFGITATQPADFEARALERLADFGRDLFVGVVPGEQQAVRHRSSPEFPPRLYPTATRAPPPVSGDDGEDRAREIPVLRGEGVPVAARQLGRVLAGDEALVEVGPLLRLVAG